MRKGYRFWLVYAAAWVPYLASFTAIFATHYGDGFFTALKEAFYNIAPVALMGGFAIALCRRYPWPREGRAKFIAAHVLLSLVYAALWVTTVPLLFALEEKLKGGPWNYQLLEGYALQWQFFGGWMIYGTVISIGYAIEAGVRLRAEVARRALAEHLRTRAELAALRAQLNPHFLFNTLHSLMALVRHDTDAAEESLDRLAALLRYVLKSNDEEGDDVPLAEEWRFVENYLALERLRFGERLRVKARIQPAAFDCLVPAFMLQPLVENAVKHAVTPQPEGATIWIEAELRDGVMSLEVRDDGPGANPEALASAKGLGLRVVRQRIEARFGESASFTVLTQPSAGFTVRLDLPAEGVLSDYVKEKAEWQFERL